MKELDHRILSGNELIKKAMAGDRFSIKKKMWVEVWVKASLRAAAWVCCRGHWRPEGSAFKNRGKSNFTPPTVCKEELLIILKPAL